MVLVTVVGTSGSTYRKPGAIMLIAEDGSSQGLISGGCLENDLGHHAREVIADGLARTVRYDLAAADDLVWGLGLGCDGAIDLLLIKLSPSAQPHLLNTIADAIQQRQPVLVALSAAFKDGQANRPEWATLSGCGAAHGTTRMLDVLRRHAEAQWPRWRCQVVSDADPLQVLINLHPEPCVLVCGAGPDALPVVDAIVNLGWECVVVDHRPAFAKPERFKGRCEVLASRPESLTECVDLAAIDAAVVMSHHLQNDACFLKQLHARQLKYIGLLGPRRRREKLIAMAGCDDDPSIFGPAGLDIGAELPESIALSIVAELHAVLCQRDGRSLLHRD